MFDFFAPDKIPDLPKGTSTAPPATLSIIPEQRGPFGLSALDAAQFAKDFFSTTSTAPNAAASAAASDAAEFTKPLLIGAAALGVLILLARIK